MKYEGKVWEGELTVGNSELGAKHCVKVTLQQKKKLILFLLIPFLPPK
jgi:hypothetical protein